MFVCCWGGPKKNTDTFVRMEMVEIFFRRHHASRAALRRQHGGYTLANMGYTLAKTIPSTHAPIQASHILTKPGESVAARQTGCSQIRQYEAWGISFVLTLVQRHFASLWYQIGRRQSTVGARRWGNEARHAAMQCARTARLATSPSERQHWTTSKWTRPV